MARWRDTEQKQRKKESQAHVPTSEDDTERRSAVSSTCFHDNSCQQGPRPCGSPVMNHPSWRWDNTHRCTHMYMQRPTPSRVSVAHTHAALMPDWLSEIACLPHTEVESGKEKHACLHQEDCFSTAACWDEREVDCMFTKKSSLHQNCWLMTNSELHLESTG